jgi:glycosyltransferase involved in cell wall biosynthesis
MHVMHVIASLSRSGTGVYEAVLGVTRALAHSRAARVTVIGAVDAVEDWSRDRQAWEEAGAEVIVVPQSRFPLGLTFRSVINDRALRGIDVVHGHGLWCGTSLAAATAARRLDCPLVISPHGMLEPWARRHHWFRKQVAWFLAERVVMGRADLLQAMSRPEVDSLRCAGLFQPVVVHPVGIARRAVEQAERSERQSPALPSGCRMCLFLSRLHPKKGLPTLFEAWRKARPSGWCLVVAGPDHRGHQAAMEQLAGRLGIGNSVTFAGPVHGRAKWRLLGSADLFILPSHSENFGIVIAEALAAGTPVIATTGTPWEELRLKNAGWWVPPDVTSVAEAIHEATRLPADALRQMGNRGSIVASERCDWSSISRIVRDSYRWLMDGGVAPSAIHFTKPGTS